MASKRIDGRRYIHLNIFNSKTCALTSHDVLSRPWFLPFILFQTIYIFHYYTFYVYGTICFVNHLYTGHNSSFSEDNAEKITVPLPIIFPNHIFGVKRSQLSNHKNASITLDSWPSPIVNCGNIDFDKLSFSDKKSLALILMSHYKLKS